MATAYVAYSGASIKALPISELIADFATEAIDGTAFDNGMFSIALDATRSGWWFLFDGASTPTSWHNAIGVVDLTSYGQTGNLTFPFTRPTGGTYSCLPRGTLLSTWASRVAAVEIDTGLYQVVLTQDYAIWDVFEGATQPGNWNASLGAIYTSESGSSGGGGGSGSIVNLLSVDYEDDWIYLEGIEDVGFAFGTERVSSLSAPASGVKVKRASPTHNEVIVAATTVGYEPTDLVFVVFAQTLMDGTAAIQPLPGDQIQAFDTNWIIKSVKKNVDFSQWRCLCKQSTLTQTT